MNVGRIYNNGNAIASIPSNEENDYYLVFGNFIANSLHMALEPSALYLQAQQMQLPDICYTVFRVFDLITEQKLQQTLCFSLVNRRGCNCSYGFCCCCCNRMHSRN